MLIEKNTVQPYNNSEKYWYIMSFRVTGCKDKRSVSSFSLEIWFFEFDSILVHIGSISNVANVRNLISDKRAEPIEISLDEMCAALDWRIYCIELYMKTAYHLKIDYFLDAIDEQFMPSHKKRVEKQIANKNAQLKLMHVYSCLSINSRTTTKY